MVVLYDCDQGKITTESFFPLHLLTIENQLNKLNVETPEE